MTTSELAVRTLELAARAFNVTGELRSAHRRPTKLLIPAMAIVLVLIAPPAGADTVTIEPVKDNTLYESLNGSVSNGAGFFVFTGRTAMGSRRRTVLAFDVAGNVPAGSTITGASLTLEMTLTITGAFDVSLHRLFTDWGEAGSDASGNEGIGAAAQNGDATWLHTFFNTDFWSNVGGDFAAAATATIAVNQVGTYTWGPSPEMLADVQGWYELPMMNFGWILVGSETSFPTAKRFVSRQHPTASIRPALTIEFTPLDVLGQCCFSIGTTDIGCIDEIMESECNNQPGQTTFGDDAVCTGNVCADCGACTASVDCDDSNACTNDVCGDDCECTSTPNFNTATQCCDPATGATTPLDDANACTLTGVCNIQTGQVTFPPADADTACDDGDPATPSDRCDGQGNCIGNPGVPTVSAWGMVVLALALLTAAKLSTRRRTHRRALCPASR